MKKANRSASAAVFVFGALAVTFLLITSTGHASFRQPAPKFNFVSLDYPGAIATTASGINSTTSPAIVGDYTDTNGVMHGYVRTSNGTFTSYDYPGSTGTSFWGINNKGAVAGYWIDTSGNVHGLFFNGKTFTDIDYPTSIFTTAYGINNSGQVVGTWVNSDGSFQSGYSLVNNVYTNVVYPASTSTLASGVNSTGNIVGEWFDTNGLAHGFELTTAIGGTYTAVNAPNAAQTTLDKINDAMQASGLTYNSAGTVFGLAANLVTNQFVSFQYPKGNTTVVRGLNNTPEYVGHYLDSSGVEHGFLAVQSTN
jgi:hypothetical protein